MITPSESRDAKFLSNIVNPTLWEMRQLIRYYIADTNGIYIRVLPEGHEHDKFIQAYSKAQEYFKNNR